MSDGGVYSKVEHVIGTKGKADLEVGKNGKHACADDNNYQVLKNLTMLGTILDASGVLTESLNHALSWYY